MSRADQELRRIRQQHHEMLGKLNYLLECFGDSLAKKNGYKGVEGMEAIWLYLIRTYHWTPAYVKSMSHEDIRFVLTQEMSGWKYEAK